MDLETIIPILDGSDLSREVRTIKTSGYDIITYYNHTRDDIEVTVNSETTYDNVTQICLIVKNGLTYLYMQCNNILFFSKVLLSSITSLSIQ